MTFDYDTALGHYGTVVAALTHGPPSADLVEALAGRCAVLRNMTSLEQAEADARAALKLAREIGYPAGEAVALAELSLISSYADDGDQAVEWARQAQRIDQDQIPGWSARKVKVTLPWALVYSGHLDDTLDLCAKVLAQARAAGDVSGQADALFLMAVLARQTGRLAEAEAYLRETAELAMQAGDRLRLIDVLDTGGSLCVAAGQYAAAVAGVGDGQPEPGTSVGVPGISHQDRRLPRPSPASAGSPGCGSGPAGA